MSKSLEYKGYKGSVEVDLDSKVLYGRILDITALVSYEGTTVEELKENFVDAVDEHMADELSHAINKLVLNCSNWEQDEATFEVLSSTDDNGLKCKKMSICVKEEHEVGCEVILSQEDMKVLYNYLGDHIEWS